METEQLGAQTLQLDSLGQPAAQAAGRGMRSTGHSVRPTPQQLFSSSSRAARWKGDVGKNGPRGTDT